MSVRSRIVDWFLKEGNTALKQEPPVMSGSAILTSTGGTSPYNAKTIKNYAQNGFMLNTTVYRAITIVAQSCASVDWNVYRIGTGKKKLRTPIHNHPLVYLLNHPNADRAQSTFIEQLISYWMIAGENYILGSFGPGSETRRAGVYPTGLYNLRPDLITLKGDERGGIQSYRYDVGNYVLEYPVWKILALRFFHPLDELSGLSPIHVAAAVIERQNAGEEWNFSLMKNMARPSGAFVAATEFSDDARMRLRREILNKYGRGKMTAGMPMLLENGLSYIQLGMSPIDADWFNSDSAAGRKIASAIGVDPLLLQDKQYSTYNNELEAKLAMWELTCFPLMEKLKDELNNWLTPFFGVDIEIDYDREPIESLKRNRQLESVTTIAEWNTGLRSFNDSAIDLALETIPDKDDFYRLGPATFVRKSDLGKFLDAQEKIWNPPEPQPGQFGGRFVKPLGGVPGAGAIGSGTAGNPSAGNTTLNAVSRNPVPLLHEPHNLRSAKEEQELLYRSVAKEREQWYAHVATGVAHYFHDELLLITNAIHSHSLLSPAKASVLATVQLHGSQLQALLAEYYGSIASDAARFVSQQFGTKCTVFTRAGIDALGKYAGHNITTLITQTQQHLETLFTDSEREQLTVEQTEARIRALYQEYKRERVDHLARHEVITAYNCGSYIAAAQLEVPLYKVWIASDAEHKHLDGTSMYFEEPFHHASEQMLFPRDSSLGASSEQLEACQCVLMYVQDYHPETNPYHQNYVAHLFASSLHSSILL